MRETGAVRIPVADAELDGDLVVPAGARGVVLFAHGSGSSRKSSRNVAVARHLQNEGLATLLMDLLTTREERDEATTGHLRFDIRLLASRLVAATDWLAARPDTRDLPVGYFGASTGGGAALVAAVERPSVKAVVSRGGRPDLAGTSLRHVRTPTLLLVGSRDEPVVDMNERAKAQMPGEVTLEIVPGASHLFEEPGTLDVVARRAAEFFLRSMG